MSKDPLDILKKACSRCKEEKTWREFYAGKKWPDGTMRFPQSWCTACMKETNSERCAARRRREKACPERTATRRSQWREYRRKLLGITPDRYRVDVPSKAPTGRVEATLVREAILRSGRDFSDIARAADVDEGTVRKAASGGHEHIFAKSALAILEALDVLPAEVGL